MRIPGFGRFGLIRRAIARLRLATRLLREPQVPIALKALLVAAGCYVILPFDVLPDFIPGLGQLDDLTITVLAIEAVIALVPRQLVEYHTAGISGRRPFAQAPAAAAPGDPRATVIDAEWRRR